MRRHERCRLAELQRAGATQTNSEDLNGLISPSPIIPLQQKCVLGSDEVVVWPRDVFA